MLEVTDDIWKLALCFVFFAPLAGALFSALFAFRDKCLIAGIIPSALLLISTIICGVMLYHFSSRDFSSLPIVVGLQEWIMLGEIASSFSIYLDTLSLIMAGVVNLVSACVHIYSIGYMSHDKGFNRFFAFLSAFVFSMLVLVFSDNLLTLFIGWEGVGLCSYLLIGFFYERKSAIFACNEAFIMNRVADLAMLVGIFFIANSLGSIYFYEMRQAIYTIDKDEYDALILGGVLLFVGAMGKSAQFPFHTWLANAMEGPTPVSALIHAATMVTAGVYLVMRLDIYSIPTLNNVGLFIVYLGAFVALFGASMALVNRDLKRIIAYSTLSQLGYMFVAAGFGYLPLALFHLFTHAFFKALLFLGAGNVMHACNDELDISKMRGLYKVLRVTFVLMLVASLALCGVFPFAGYFSKDLILEMLLYDGHYAVWFALLLGAFCTAFYSTRLLMVIFTPRLHIGIKKSHLDSQNLQSTSPNKPSHPNAHEAPTFMLVTMLPLAILAIVGGVFESWFAMPSLLRQLIGINEVHSTNIAMASAMIFGGIIFAIIKYRNGFRESSLDSKQGIFYKLLLNQYYIPKIYEKCIIMPYEKIATLLWKVEIGVIDKATDSIALFLAKLGKSEKEIQSGDLSQSLRLMVFGVFILLGLMIVGLWEVLGA